MDVIPLSTSTDGAPTSPPAACAACGAPLAPDQRYCLACGRPASPVRFAFLDVLQSDRSRETLAGGEHLRFGQQIAGTAILGAAPSVAGYQPPADPPGTLGSLRRYSGLFGLLGVLLASLLIGLLVGHWLTGNNGNGGKQVVEVKGLSAPLAAAASPTTSPSARTPTGAGSGGSSPSSSHSSGSSSQSHSTASKSEGGVSESSAEEAEAAKEVKSTKALPAAHKTSSSTLQKLEHTTGKQHAKEVKAALGNGPIETH